MADDGNFTLDVWSGDWDVPSVDPDCLAVIAYCKFSGVPVTVVKGNNPSKSPSGSLPVLKHGNRVESRVPNILTYLKLKNWGTDIDLSSKEQADIKAFSAMLEEKLRPAYLHTWWIDEKTYIDTTRPWFAKACSFPRNFYIPGRIQSTATKTVYQSKTTNTITESEVDTKIYKDAKECLNYLSYKLGDKDFFFGDRPSSLDGLVFGYVAPLLKGPLTTNQLVTHLNGTPNLCNHCSRVLSRYFPLSPEEIEERSKREQKRREAMQTDALEFPNKRCNMVLAAIFAITSMVGYALMSGMIRLETINVGSKEPVDVYEEFSTTNDDEGGEGGEDWQS